MATVSRIEKFWYSNSQLKWLLWPISQLLFGITGLKYWLYKKHLLSVASNKIPVLVVGNITVGGTGKTPFIAWLAEKLQRHGLKVGIVSRGYRSRATHYPHLINQADDVTTIGDEAFMLYQQLQLPMAIDANRSRAVAALVDANPLDLIISDDGLQHYSMQRRIEFLLVDASRGFGNSLCLPLGPLRESTSRLKQVDLIVQNGGESLLPEIPEVSTPAILMAIKTLALIHVQTGNSIALSNIKSQNVYAVCGIGNPQRFFDSLAPLCNSYTPHIFPDHHQFSTHDFTEFDDRLVIMTEKDAVKCKEFAQPQWYFLKVGASICDKDSDKLLHIINNELKFNNKLKGH